MSTEVTTPVANTPMADPDVPERATSAEPAVASEVDAPPSAAGDENAQEPNGDDDAPDSERADAINSLLVALESVWDQPESAWASALKGWIGEVKDLLVRLLSRPNVFIANFRQADVEYDDDEHGGLLDCIPAALTSSSQNFQQNSSNYWAASRSVTAVR